MTLSTKEHKFIQGELGSLNTKENVYFSVQQTLLVLPKLLWLLFFILKNVLFLLMNSRKTCFFIIFFCFYHLFIFAVFDFFVLFYMSNKNHL